MSDLQRIIFRDTEYLSQTLRHANVRAMQISRGPFEATLSHYCLADWDVQTVDFAQGTSTCSGDAPSDRYSLLLPLAFQATNSLLGRRVTRSSAALYAPRSEHADVSAAGTRLVVLTAPLRLIEDMPELRGLLPRTGSVHGNLPDQVIDWVRGLLADLDAWGTKNASLLGSSQVARSAQDAFALAFLELARSVQVTSQRGRPEYARPALLRELRDVVAASEGEPIYASELCKKLNISFPTLRRIFLERHGVPPARFLLLQRYHCARQRLRSGSYHSVAEVAQSCGFWNASRFTANYKSLFHELPSQTLAHKGRPPYELRQ